MPLVSLTQVKLNKMEQLKDVYRTNLVDHIYAQCVGTVTELYSFISNPTLNYQARIVCYFGDNYYIFPFFSGNRMYGIARDLTNIETIIRLSDEKNLIFPKNLQYTIVDSASSDYNILTNKLELYSNDIRLCEEKAEQIYSLRDFNCILRELTHE